MQKARRIYHVSIASAPFSEGAPHFAIGLKASGNTRKQTGGSVCESNPHNNVNSTTCRATDGVLGDVGTYKAVLMAGERQVVCGAPRRSCAHKLCVPQECM